MCCFLAAAYAELRHLQIYIKDLVRRSAMHIMDQGGVVRSIRFWDTQTLPQRMRRHRTNHTHGECVPVR